MSKVRRQRRLKVLAGRYQSLTKKPSAKYPTITVLAKANRVSTSTIYRDLEHLRQQLGKWVIPTTVPLGGKFNGKKSRKT